MNYDEFKKSVLDKAIKGDKWNWDLFKIVCNKCFSNKVEVAGECEDETGYYEEHTATGSIIVKCHSCGNAIVLNLSEYGNNNTIDNDEDLTEAEKGVFLAKKVAKRL